MHTPGPWVVEELVSKDCEGDDAETLICAYANPDGKNGATVATVNRWSYGDDPPQGDSEDNARLIAAAPDLLAACKVGLARIESDIESTNNKVPDGDLLRAAIAKAEGRNE